MRDMALMVVMGGLLPFALFRPYVGLLIFSWLAYFRPQELCWSFARDFPFSFVVAGVMILGIVLGNLFGAPFSREERVVRVERRTMILVLLWGAIGLSTIYAVHRDASAPLFVEFSKIVAIALLTTGLCGTKQRLRWLFIVIAFSLGAMALKHALFGVRTGEFRILKGPGGMMDDNNDFGLALVMALPLLYYVATTERNAWMKAAAVVFGAASVATLFFTHSRGGFLALGLITVLWLLKFRQRGWALIVAPVLVVLTVLFLPPDLIGRMRGVLQGNPDESAVGRVVAWQKAINMSLDRPLFGVGPRNFVLLWPEYDPEAGRQPIVAHNTFLQITAESGVVSLVFFLALIFSAIAGLRLLRGPIRDVAGEEWRVDYSHALELSIVGYVAGALFLTRTNFDLFYQLVGMIPALIYAADRGESVREVFAYWRGRPAVTGSPEGALASSSWN